MVAVNPTWIDGVGMSGYLMRRVDSVLTMHNGNALGARSGVVPGSGGLTVSLSGTTISVSSGIALVYFAGEGTFRAPMTSISTATLQAAHATLPRIDLVYLRVWCNSVDGSGLNQADVVYLPGTPASTPVAPTPAGTQIYMPLATISVPASGGGAASVSTAVRPFTVAPGGILPSTTAPPSPYVGQVYDNGTDLLRYNGSGWDTYQKVINTPWITPTLATGYAHDGNSNGQVQYRAVTIEGTRYMEWRGGLGITYSSNALQNSGNFLAAASTLAAAYRPPSRRTVPVACSAATSSQLNLKVDFQTDGTVQIVGPTTASSDSYATPVIRPPWLSLNNVRYAVS
ncbi:hypothetical protein RM863_35320 [Streptomyces sp. DSM 41014]|uniref:Minor tail protein n=1 Tax=Streptomyces hintoniae TaxID=3075521 RepID=A0ABU2UX18_9ACTN|nr:hypothetical protein [Streptomyces sp. DSM 41014]MDT0477406.1 hypothetical protein [Streptomyces sp. DSM 41014]